MKLYMGPETAEEWICNNLSLIRGDIQKDIQDTLLFFIRFLDPDFHIRLRVYVPHREDFSRVVSVVNLHSGEMIKQGLIWKTEICTYEREVERYSQEKMEIFEEAFSIDSEFWIDVLPWIRAQSNSEDLRWKLALISTYRYYRDLIEDQDEIIRIMSKIVQALKHEQKPGRTVLFQVDQKYRHLRKSLLPLLEDELKTFPEIEELLRKRSSKLRDIFEPPFQHGDSYFADLVHMSLNRVLRSKHRMQEFVLYNYLLKLMKTKLALSK